MGIGLIELPALRNYAYQPYRSGMAACPFISRRASRNYGERDSFLMKGTKKEKGTEKSEVSPKKILRRPSLHQPSGPAIGNGQMINNSNDVFSNRMNRFALGLALSPFKKMREDKRAQVER